jgi:hypothetical protein
MSIKNLINYLLTESLEEVDLIASEEVEPVIDEIKEIIRFDPDFARRLKNATSQQEIQELLGKEESIAEEFQESIEDVAQIIYVANLLNQEVFNIHESVEEEKGYRGPKKYKKVVGSGKNKRTVRYGAKGYSIAPGTSKGNSYCARSYGQMKDHPSAAKDPNSPLRLSRKKWRCSGKYSKK